MHTNLLQQYWVKWSSFLPWIAFVHSLKISHLFLDFLFCCIYLLYLCRYSTHLFTCLYNKCFNQSHILLQLSFLQSCVAILGPLPFPMNFRNTSKIDFYITKKISEILIKIVFYLQFRKKYWVSPSSTISIPTLSYVKIQTSQQDSSHKKQIS